MLKTETTSSSMWKKHRGSLAKFCLRCVSTKTKHQVIQAVLLGTLNEDTIHYPRVNDRKQM